MKTSFNRRALRLLTIFAVLSGAVIVALFFFVERNQIKERATETLAAFAADPDGVWAEISPEIYFISTDDIGDDTLSEYAVFRFFQHSDKLCPLCGKPYYHYGVSTEVSRFFDGPYLQ